jgi:hypothetical protein
MSYELLCAFQRFGCELQPMSYELNA